MSKNMIVYVGNFSFPFGNASGKRVYGNGKALRNAGYEVVFLGMSNKLEKGVTIQETEEEFDGFKYYNLAYPKGNKDWIDYKSVFNSFVLWMEDKVEQTKAIVCYGSPRLSIFITKVIRWGKKNGIHVVTDCVDWLEVNTGNVFFDLPKTLDTFYQKAIANKKADGVICISTYLEEYYKKAGKKTVIIPPLSCDVPADVVKESNKCLEIVYAGTPFRGKTEIKKLEALKDRVDKMVLLLGGLKKRGLQFKFFYYGVEKEEFLCAFPNLRENVEELGDNLIFCGMRDNAEVAEQIRKADFTILVRDIKRSTMAGFPTKVSESISLGTPVITTKTSDISFYLEEGKEVIFISHDDMAQSAGELAILLKDDKSKNMKEQCTNNKIFYYESYEKQLENFFDQL